MGLLSCLIMPYRFYAEASIFGVVRLGHQGDLCHLKQLRLAVECLLTWFPYGVYNLGRYWLVM